MARQLTPRISWGRLLLADGYGAGLPDVYAPWGIDRGASLLTISPTSNRSKTTESLTGSVRRADRAPAGAPGGSTIGSTRRHVLGRERAGPATAVPSSAALHHPEATYPASIPCSKFLRSSSTTTSGITPLPSNTFPPSET